MTQWKRSYTSGLNTVGTRMVIASTVSDVDGGGAVERAETIADNVAEALGQLVAALEDKGVFTAHEIQTIFQVWGFEPVEDEA